MGEGINVRFRKKKDDKLKEALKRQMKIEGLDASEIVRKALTKYLFIDYAEYHKDLAKHILIPQAPVLPEKEPEKPEFEEKEEKIVLEEVKKEDNMDEKLKNILDDF